MARIQDGDFFLAGKGSKIQFLFQLTNLLNADLFFSGQRLDDADIRVVAVLNARAIRALATEIAGRRRAMNRFRKAESNRFLTHTLHAYEKIGMMQPPMVQRLTHDFYLFLMTDDLRKTHLCQLSIDDVLDLLPDLFSGSRRIDYPESVWLGPR